MLPRLDLAHNICSSSPLPFYGLRRGFCMDMRCRLFLGLVAGAFLFGATANAQDSQSLGDVARQQRQQKELSASVQGKDTAESKVITNEEIPERRDEPAAAVTKGKGSDLGLPASRGAKQSAEFWKSRIQAQKSNIASLQRRIDEMNGSIRFSSVNCGANCVLRNERQRSKQQQVERMQGQLEQQKKRLEEMQETARRQGYGSSVYDP
jgi:hypothetical protein